MAIPIEECQIHFCLLSYTTLHAQTPSALAFKLINCKTQNYDQKNKVILTCVNTYQKPEIQNCFSTYPTPGFRCFPQILSFFCQYTNALSDCITHIVWSDLTFFQLQPTHRMYWKASHLNYSINHILINTMFYNYIKASPFQRCEILLFIIASNRTKTPISPKTSLISVFNLQSEVFSFEQHFCEHPKCEHNVTPNIFTTYQVSIQLQCHFSFPILR